jgi:hypothetical protein
MQVISWPVERLVSFRRILPYGEEEKEEEEEEEKE